MSQRVNEPKYLQCDSKANMNSTDSSIEAQSPVPALDINSQNKRQEGKEIIQKAVAKGSLKGFFRTKRFSWNLNYKILRNHQPPPAILSDLSLVFKLLKRKHYSNYMYRHQATKALVLQEKIQYTRHSNIQKHSGRRSTEK